MNTDEFSRQLGAGLRAVRMQRRLTLREAAEKFPGGLKYSTLLSYERGYRGIPIERFAELAAFYGVPAAVLIP